MNNHAPRVHLRARTQPGIAIPAAALAQPPSMRQNWSTWLTMLNVAAWCYALVAVAQSVAG